MGRPGKDFAENSASAEGLLLHFLLVCFSLLLYRDPESNMASSEPEEGVQPAKSIASQARQAVALSWKYKHLVPTILGTVVWHYTVGPPQASWPLETDIFTAIARKVRQPSQGAKNRGPKEKKDVLKGIQAVRKMAAIEKWLPPPRNGVAVDVQFQVQKRGLGGILEVFDAREDGGRTLDAEWVVHREVLETTSSRVVLYFHGGGYVLMSKDSHRPVTIHVSKASHARVFSVNYRLAPEHPFPGGLHDAVASYQYLTEDLKIPASSIYVGGDSAGGGLSLALLLYIRDMKLPMLGGAILLSPWCDLTTSLGSWEDNVQYDYLAEGPEEDRATDTMHMYLGEDYDKHVLHPYVTSCIADLSGLPPLLIQAGGAEVLLDESTLLAQRAATAGVQVTHEILDGGVHVAQAFIKTEISRTAFIAMEKWFEKQLDPPPATFDLGHVDEELRTRLAKLPSDATFKATHKSTYTFIAETSDPPQIKLRKIANPAVVKAVDENNLQTRSSISAIYVATKSPPESLIGRVFGRLHL